MVHLSGLIRGSRQCLYVGSNSFYRSRFSATIWQNLLGYEVTRRGSHQLRELAALELLRAKHSNAHWRDSGCTDCGDE